MASYRQRGCGILAAGLLALALVVSGRSNAEEKKGGSIADSLTPGAAEVLAKINVKQILSSPLFQKYLLEPATKGLQGPEFKQFLEAVGVDPLKDVDGITLANVGTTNPKWLVVIRGRFDPAKIATAAEAAAKKDNNLKITKEAKHTIFEITKNPNYPVFGTVPDKGFVVVANDKDNLLKAAGSNTPAQLNADLRAALGKIGGKESYWVAVVVTDEMKKAMQSNPEAKRFADKLKSITATLNVTDNAHLSVQIHTTDAQAANQLKMTVEGLKGPLELIAQGNQQAAPVLGEIAKSIQIGTTNTTVTIDLKVTEDQLKQLAALGKGGATGK